MKRAPIWTQSSVVLGVALLAFAACSTQPAIQNESNSSVAGEIPISRTVSSHSPNFDWPVDDARFTRGYFLGTKRPHFGIDLAGPKNTPILAAQNGVVIYTGRAFKGFGRMVLVESGFGWATLYAHLNKILVKEGQRVTQGEVIGSMGNTGRSRGVHLHFEVRKDRVPVDPLQYLPSGKEIVEKVASKYRESVTL
ncbi:MAG: M23 family metallopeptidase [Pseudobdellovibrionaceae bacterium]